MARREQPDFLDRMVAEREAKSPGFAKKVDDAYHRRVMGRALSARRQALGLSQTEVARRMKTSQPAVSRLEAGGDVRISTLTRYLDVVGIRADWPEHVVAAK
jgi:ribosome-binding protein aMBF1 (putative translation factor)